MPITITTKLEQEPHLAEIYQSTNLKMGLLRPTGPESYERFTPMVKCRDFLTDVYTFSDRKRSLKVYGMEFDGKKEAPDMSGVYLLLEFPKHKKPMQEILKSQMSYIWKIEETNKLPLSQLLPITETSAVLVADKAWLQNCLSFSLYTLLVRLLCQELPVAESLVAAVDPKSKNSDSRLFLSVHPSVWKRVFANLSSIYTKEFCGIPAKAGDYAVHHNSGFISVFGWHKELSKEWVQENLHFKEMKARGFQTKYV